MRLLRWSLWFFLIQGLAIALIALRYVVEHTWPTAAVARIYVLGAWLGHSWMLALVSWALCVLPAVLVLPRRRFVQGLGVAVAASGLAFVLIDSLVFAQDRFHIDALSARVLGLRTWGFAALYLGVFAGFCWILSGLVWRRLTTPGSGRTGGALVVMFVGLFLGMQALHAWADAMYYVPITSFTPVLPLYRPLTAKHLLSRWLGAVDLTETRSESELEAIGESQAWLLDYPKAPLRCELPERPLNVLLIGVDAMRADARNQRLAPSISAFAEQAIRFDAHWSGGNGTRPGLFSLFYGLPATYWKAFYGEQRPPVLIETFQRMGYELGVFPSNPPDRLVGLDRTVFRSVSNLPSTTGDVNVTQGWLRFIDAQDESRPFFGFLFYESPPGGCLPDYPRPEGVDLGASGEAGRRACYETAVHFADAQVGRVLEDVRRRGLFEDTVVIVTSDHGEEFEDDNNQGFKGHGSGYSRYQLRTPMLVHWPGRAPVRVERRTSHHDIAPTLLTEVLGCSNPPSDYSSGSDLFSGSAWDWLVAGSYTSMAVVEPDQVTVSYGSYFEVRDPDYRLQDEPRLRSDVISAALRETTRFYQR